MAKGQRVSNETKEMMERLAGLKLKKKEISEEIKDLQREILDKPDAPNECSTEYGNMKKVSPTETIIEDTKKTYNYLKRYMSFTHTQLIEMMKFSVSSLKKEAGNKTIEKLEEKGYVYKQDKEVYYKLSTKKE